MMIIWVEILKDCEKELLYTVLIIREVVRGCGDLIFMNDEISHIS